MSDAQKTGSTNCKSELCRGGGFCIYCERDWLLAERILLRSHLELAMAVVEAARDMVRTEKSHERDVFRAACRAYDEMEDAAKYVMGAERQRHR